MKWLMEEITCKHIGKIQRLGQWKKSPINTQVKPKDQEKKTKFCATQIQVQAQQEARSKRIFP